MPLERHGNWKLWVYHRQCHEGRSLSLQHVKFFSVAVLLGLVCLFWSAWWITKENLWASWRWQHTTLWGSKVPIWGKRITGSKSAWKNLSVWRFLPLQWNNCLRLINKALKNTWEERGIIFFFSFQFATGALEHRVYEVRDVALRIIFDMYRKHRTAVLEYLPPDDASIRKTVLYKTLFDGFSKIDGKLSEAEIRVRNKIVEHT